MADRLNHATLDGVNACCGAADPRILIGAMTCPECRAILEAAPKRPTAEHVLSGLDDTAGHVWTGVIETGCTREWNVLSDTSERVGLYDALDLDSDGDLFWTCLCGARRPFTPLEAAKVDWL